MAPTLRSSTPSTPTGKSGTTDTPNSTPRKTPQCTKCKRPRAGHPRQGCPYVDSPLGAGSSAPNTQGPENITDALESMQIASPRDCDENVKATVHNRRLRRSSAQANLIPADTLASLSTNSSEIVARLLQPGMFDNDTSEDEEGGGKRKTVVRWQETILATPTRSKGKNKIFPRSPMPGTLTTPSPESSYQSMHTSFQKQESPVRTTNASTSNPRPLARSMSAEQREIFIDELNHASKATVYVLPKADVPAVQQSAAKLQFHTRVVMNQDKHDLDGLLIVGRDEKAVQALVDKVELESKKQDVVQEGHPTRGGGRLQAAAGGAVVGAMATFTGLAFS